MMDRGWWTKFVLLILIVAVSAGFVYPTLARLDPQTSKFPIKSKMNLGLDLQGGLYLVLGVDFNQVFKSVLDRQASSLEQDLKEKTIAFKSVHLNKAAAVDDPRLIVEFDEATKPRIHDLIKQNYSNLRLTEEKPTQFEMGLSHVYRAEIRDKTINQSIEVIRNRIDQFGVTEPGIAAQGFDRIVVELPGVREIERAKELIGRTARLEFKLVNPKLSPEAISQIIGDVEKATKLSYDWNNPGETKFSDYVRQLNEHARAKIPQDSEIAFERQTNMAGKTIGVVPYLLFSKTDVSGDELQDAQVVPNQETRLPEVAFRLNPRGAVLFEKLTGENVGKQLAIVLDNTVFSAPRINSRIGANGVITLGQRPVETLNKEARDLSIVLRAGALPAQLEFLEQRVIGPSLGSDSIQYGTKAGIIGILAVFLLTLVYYRVAGAIAVVSLVFNVLILMAILVGLEATLTLPGIAGIALTVGIAVDSNVVIFERIREELMGGKSIGGAVEAGFQKAFRTIMDSNVTNAAGAVVLMTYGTGPIKGFAVTLLIGIVVTLFTAVFVCRLFFDYYLARLQRKRATTLSI